MKTESPYFSRGGGAVMAPEDDREDSGEEFWSANEDNARATFIHRLRPRADANGSWRERRFEMLPVAARIHEAKASQGTFAGFDRMATQANASPLGDFIAQPHENVVWILMASIRENESAHDLPPVLTIAADRWSKAPATNEENGSYERGTQARSVAALVESVRRRRA